MAAETMIHLRKLCKDGTVADAVKAAHSMNRHGISLSPTIFYVLLQECSNKKDLNAGRQLHSLIANSAYNSNHFLCNHLIRMFSSCGSLLEALKEFHRIPQKDHYMWTSIISAHRKTGQSNRAIQLYHEMRQSKISPTVYTYVSVVNACADARAMAEGRAIHQHILASECASSIYVGNSLIDMYAKCGSLDDALAVFVSLPKRDVVSWNSILAGCIQNECENQALQLFEQMQKQNVQPDRFTFASILKAIGRIGSLEKGRNVHSQLVESGLGLDNFLGSSLIDMYAKFGSIDDACGVFCELPQRDVVSWNAMIAALVSSHAAEALQLFEKMLKTDLNPDKFTFASIFKACGSIGSLEFAERVHGLFAKSALRLDAFTGATIVDMFAKCGSFEKAWKIFASLREQTVVTWTTMLSACVQNCRYHEALHFFERMQEDGFKPDEVTFVTVIKACGSISSLDKAKALHNQLNKSGLGMDLLLGNALIDMYAKCGSMGSAREVFLGMLERDVVSWSTLIAGYAQDGYGLDALQHFKSMQWEGVSLDKITFVGVLNACSHLGLLDEGYRLFGSMQENSGIKPDMDHYTLMVDLLGHAGKLDQALALINQLPLEPTVDVWMSLLGACKTHGNLDVGLVSFENILKLEPTNGTAYVLLSNLLAAASVQSKKWSKDEKS